MAQTKTTKFMSEEDHIDNDFEVLKDKIFQINNRSKPGLTHLYCCLMIFEYFLSCVCNYSCGFIVSRTLNITCFMNQVFPKESTAIPPPSGVGRTIRNFFHFHSHDLFICFIILSFLNLQFLPE